ncbi:MAG: ABC transporter permease [Deltaproteobacteria bacterium]|jgi:peptide/nickel transport system permease protein|nr:ABC transporter permease [Deltaproteobacteria bacterium]
MGLNQAIVLSLPVKHRLNRRILTISLIVITCLAIIAILIGGIISTDVATTTSFLSKNLSPSSEHYLGTDWLGRDMLARTLKGLSLSIIIGLGASTVSAFLALILGVASASFGGKIDAFVSWGVDVVMGLPHLMLLILISYALGKGLLGVTVAVAISHWPNLTRVIRAEILQLKASNYIQIAIKLGHSSFYIAKNHMLPHIFPQFLVGLILLFPHAILHEAAITFLGFGLSPEKPGIGIILSESMKYLSLGYWWLSVFPGLALLATVMLFDRLGHSIRELIDPHSTHN